MNILIIEDEKPTARDLRKTILQAEPSASVVAIVGSVEEGKAYLARNHRVDLIFSDIQLGDGLSFEIFESLQPPVPVVFCTAYNEYALRAFKSFGIDYILKPFDKEVVTSAIQKFSRLSGPQHQKPTPDYNDLFQQLKKQFEPASKPSIILHQGEKIIPLESEKIALFFIEHANVYALTFDQKKIATQYKLDALERKFSPHFFRANRQYLVNRKAVKQASQHFHRKLQVHLNIPFAETILIGKEKVTSFLDWLSNR